jgi:predicted amidohydrolase YtcJ
MTTPSLILNNGNVLTMDEANPKAQAVAVGQDGRILAIGNDAEVSPLATADTHVVNLQGRTLMPGFFDCHLHLRWLGVNLGHVNLAPTVVKDKADIIQRLRERMDAQPELTCVQGNRYDQNQLPGGEHPTRHDLDRVSTTLPVLIVHTSGHASVVNSKALAMLGITRDTDDPVGGEIVRDASGEPNGVLLETASWNNLDRILPQLTREDAVEALGRGNRYLLARGITSATDANTEPGEIEWYGQAVARNVLQVRTNCMVNWADVVKQSGEKRVPSPDELQPQTYGVNGHRLFVGQAKLFSDGAITTRTCWLTEPFVGLPENNYGMPLHPPDELRELIVKAHLAGWQIATHAIGNRAIDLVLDCYADAQRRQTRARPGHRIEHCMLLDDELMARLRRQNIWAIGQPEFLIRLGDAYVTALGEERANRLSPYATLENRGIAQAFSSDNPVVPGSPLDGLRAAIERKTLQGRILNSAECLDAATALYAYTAAPAHASRVERDRGTLEAGKWADFVLLSADPLTTPLDEWERLTVEATIVGGECLYGAEKID